MVNATPPTDIMPRLRQALEGRDRAQVNELITALLSQRASLGRQWRSLALVLEHNGELRAASRAMTLYAEQTADPGAWLDFALLSSRIGEVHEALAVLEKLPPDFPSAAGNAYLRGTFNILLGIPDEARQALLRAVRLDPHRGEYWHALATVADQSPGCDILDAMTAHDPRRTGRSLQNEDAYFYGLGAMLGRTGDADAAFGSIEIATRLNRDYAPYDHNAAERIVEGVERDFDRSAIDAIAATITIDTNRPVIVSGPPRSGTTLVEQILTSHSSFAGGGELDLMRLIVGEIGGHSAGALARYVRERPADRAAALYLHLLDERFGATGRVVDKRLTASRTLGLLAALLPEAPLIWLSRTPLDVAWSCFRTYFGKTLPWSNDLTSIGRHLRLEDRLLSVWRERLADRLLVVPYESLVDDPAEWIARIARHCSLAIEDAIFAPHLNRRVVTTASVLQVREPINNRGIGAAESYRQFLQPFADAYYG